MFSGCVQFFWQAGSAAAKTQQKSGRIHCGFRPGPPAPGSGSARTYLFSLALVSSRSPKTARSNPTPRQHLADGKLLEEGGGPSNAFQHRHVHRETHPALWSNGIAIAVVHCSDCKLVRKAGRAGTTAGRNRKEGRREKPFFSSLRSSVLFNREHE